jgi:hypothetical protein
VGAAFLQQVRGWIERFLEPGNSLLGIADCARWIRDFFARDLGTIADKTLLLDWYHLRVRCAEAANRAWRVCLHTFIRSHVFTHVDMS